MPIIERRYSPGEHPYMRGDPDEGLWFLLEGTLEVYKLYGAFREATVRLLDGKGLFGEPSLRPTGRHRDSAEAISACRVAKVPKAPLLRHPLGGFGLRPRAAPSLRRVRRGARSCGGAAARSGGRQPTGVPFAGASGALRGGGGRGRALRVRLSQQDLSCMVACTREAVSKAMSEFREAGLIETPRPCTRRGAGRAEPWARWRRDGR